MKQKIATLYWDTKLEKGVLVQHENNLTETEIADAVEDISNELGLMQERSIRALKRK